MTCDDTHHYLGRFHNQVSVLAEGRNKELFGWIMPGVNKFTITRTTIGHFLKINVLIYNDNERWRAFDGANW